MDSELEEVCRTGNLEALRQLLQDDGLLLDKLATIPLLTDNPVHIASLLGYADFVREIISRRPELARDLNGQGFSALHLASAKSHLSVVKELLKVGSELCLIVDKDGLMPIHTAAIKGRIHVLRELSDACLESMQAVTSHGETVLHLAVRSNCYEAVEFLVEKMNGGQLLNYKDEKGNTLLHLAIARKQFHVIKFLLSNERIDVNSMNLKGCTPLDVLLDSSQEHGDLVLGEIIRAAGGKTAEEIVLQRPAHIEFDVRDNSVTPPRSSSSHIGRTRKLFHLPPHSRIEQSNQFTEDHKNTPGTLMVVATLIATITFQAGLSPPDIFKKNTETLSPPPPSFQGKGFILCRTFCGKSGSQADQKYLDKETTLFLIFDMVGLFASLSIILLLICVVPQKKRMMMKFLIWIMWVAVFSTAMAFSIAIRDIFPNSSATIFRIFIRGWFSILLVATIWICIRFVKHLLWKVGWLKKNGENRKQVSMQKGSAYIAKRIVAVMLMIIAVLTTIFINILTFGISL